MPRTSFDPSYISFQNVTHNHVKECFLKVMKKYTPLHQHQILLKKKKIESRTMQAQPIFDRSILFRKKRKYKVEYAYKTKVDDPIHIHLLPENVLIGWFAHELGHLIDYQTKSNVSLISFGIGYIFSEKVKKYAEMMADLHAIDFGFAKEILATKRFILDHSDIPEDYKKNISKYYMSPEDVEKYVLQQEKSLLDLDDIPLLFI